MCFTKYKSFAKLVLSARPTVVNPRQMFHPSVPRPESRKRPLSPTFMVRLGILYQTHVEQSHDELCVKQCTITTQTRLIVLMARISSASLSFQKTPSKPLQSIKSRKGVAFNRRIN